MFLQGQEVNKVNPGQDSLECETSDNWEETEISVQSQQVS